jgi:hypothetical protein
MTYNKRFNKAVMKFINKQLRTAPNKPTLVLPKDVVDKLRKHGSIFNK